MTEEQKKSEFRFTGFQVVETNLSRLSVESNGKLQSRIELSGTLFKTDRRFELVMDTKFFEEDVFDARIKLIGNFEFKNELAETADHYFFLNAPAILFPHVRAYVSALTALSGMAAILLPTLNLVHLAERLKQSTIVKE